MPRLPKRVKFRKQMRGNLRKQASRGNYIAFGEYGLQALEPHWVTARQIEAGRIAAQHYLRRQGKVVIRVFPDKPISKPLETRMGKGKADVDYWAARVKAGTILYEISACRWTWPSRPWPASPGRCPFVVASSDADWRSDHQRIALPRPKSRR